MARPEMWHIKLRADQVRCIIETLDWVMMMQGSRIDHGVTSDLDKFSHRIAHERLSEIRALLLDIGVDA